MRTLNLSVITLVLLSACSSSTRMASNSDCDGVGLVPGTAAYDQCLEDSQVRSLASERMLFKTNNNKPLTMLAQQSLKPMTPLLNCTSYSKPIAGQPTLCD